MRRLRKLPKNYIPQPRNRTLLLFIVGQPLRLPEAGDAPALQNCYALGSSGLDSVAAGASTGASAAGAAGASAAASAGAGASSFFASAAGAESPFSPFAAKSRANAEAG